MATNGNVADLRGDFAVQQTTWIVMIAVAVFLIAYDIIAYIVGGNSATFSAQLRWLQLNFPGVWTLLVFVVAYVCGHIAWPLSR